MNNLASENGVRIKGQTSPISKIQPRKTQTNKQNVRGNIQCKIDRNGY